MEIQACTTGATAALCAAIGGIVLTGGAAPEVGAIAKSGKAIVKGDIAAAKFVAKQAGTTLLGSDAAQTAEVEKVLALVSTAESPALLLHQLNAALVTRTYLAGYSLSLADVAAFVPVSRAGAGGASLPAHVARWRGMVEAALAVPLAQVEAVIGSVRGGAVVAAAPAAVAATAPTAVPVGTASGSDAAAPASGKGGKGKGGKGGEEKGENHNAGGGGESGSMPQLEGAIMGEVVTRFPPEPSGYLHIGHVKAVLLNDFYARHYKGRLIIRFDDTNPSKEKEEFEANIIADLAALGVVGDIVTHTSDYFELCQDTARSMIAAGNAFMDDTPQEQMRQERGDHVDSARRAAGPAENLRLFEVMLSGGVEGSKWCLRAKINMADPNGTMRDPVLYRVNETPHHRTGSRYKAYPTYDFACPIVDSIEGVTHALRTSEYADRIAQYEWIQATLGLRKVRIHEFSRLNFIYTLLSKRKLTWFADNKYVDGWYDPRFPTVQGVLRRGVTVPALREFILSQGASKRVLDMEWDKFWSTNKKHIDPVAPRYTAIADAGRVRVHLYGEGCPPEAEVRTLGLHPKNADVGSKPVWFGPSLWLEQEDVAAMKEGEEITIMKWGNAIVREIVRADGGSGAVLSAEAELHLEGDFKKTEKKVTWLAAGGEAVPMLLQDFDYLITVPKLEEGDDFMSVINHKTLVETVAAGEPALRAVPAGAIVQLERKGFFRVDRAASASAPMLLFAIPDGRVKPWGVGSAAHLAEVAAKEKAKGKDEEKVKLKLGKQPKPMANKTAAPPPVSS